MLFRQCVKMEHYSSFNRSFKKSMAGSTQAFTIVNKFPV